MEGSFSVCMFFDVLVNSLEFEDTAKTHPQPSIISLMRSLPIRTPDELIEMVDAKTGFVVDALLEGKILLDDGTINDARSRLVDSLKRLKAKRLKHGCRYRGITCER